MVDPPYQSVQEGEPATFTCKGKGHPTPDVKWTRGDGQPLPPHVDDEYGVLRIPQCKVTDGGDYICTATNPSGSDSKPVQLHVEIPGE